jgi:hypothetical protein
MEKISLVYVKLTACAVHVGKQTVRQSCAVGGYVCNMTKEGHLVRAICSDVTGEIYKM